MPILLRDSAFLLVHVLYSQKANTRALFVPSVRFDTDFLSRRIEPAACKMSQKLRVPSRSGSSLAVGGRGSLSWGGSGGSVQAGLAGSLLRTTGRRGLFPALHFQTPLQILAKETEAYGRVYEIRVILGVLCLPIILLRARSFARLLGAAAV